MIFLSFEVTPYVPIEKQSRPWEEVGRAIGGNGHLIFLMA
jgi:hypothetical protein